MLYYLCMICFNDAEITALIKRKKTCDLISFAIAAILIVAAVIAAVLAKPAYENYLGADWNLYLSAFIVAVIFLLAFVFHLIFFVSKTNGQLNYAVAKRVADAFLKNKELLEGGDKAEFEVTFDGDTLTVTRVNFKREIALSRSDVAGGTMQALAGGANSVRFDISALKSLPAVYGAFGTRVWAFIQAYYAVNGGFDEVTVTDNTGKTPAVLTVVKGGKPCGNADKNYYIKRGLVK